MGEWVDVAGVGDRRWASTRAEPHECRLPGALVGGGVGDDAGGVGGGGAAGAVVGGGVGEVGVDGFAGGGAFVFDEDERGELDGGGGVVGSEGGVG